MTQGPRWRHGPWMNEDWKAGHGPHSPPGAFAQLHHRLLTSDRDAGGGQ
jgi:hypothetical protein